MIKYFLTYISVKIATSKGLRRNSRSSFPSLLAKEKGLKAKLKIKFFTAAEIEEICRFLRESSLIVKVKGIMLGSIV